MRRFLGIIVGIGLLLILLFIVLVVVGAGFSFVSIAVPVSNGAAPVTGSSISIAPLIILPLSILLLLTLVVVLGVSFLVRILSRSRGDASKGLEADDQRILREMHRGMGEMERRVESLEVILMGRERSCSREL